MISCSCSLVLFLFVSHVLGSLACARTPFTVNAKVVPRISANSHTFLSKNFPAKRFDSLSQLRNSSYNPIDLRLKELREAMISGLIVKEEANIFEFLERLQALSDEYPELDHVNRLYFDKRANLFRPLFHFLIFNRNSEMFNVLEDYDVDPNLKDSNGHTALELAHANKLTDITLKLIIYHRECILFPFKGHPTFIHYAAVKDRTKLLELIAEFYDFSESISEDGRISPLEAALMKKRLEAADYLIKLRAYYQKETIEHIYIKSLKQFAADPAYPLFLISRFPFLIYLTDNSRQDLMLHAIKHDCIAVVEKLFYDCSYDPDQVNYKILNEALRLKASEGILVFILEKITSI